MAKKTNTIKQLITHGDNVSVSVTKFWFNIACVVSTGIVIWYAYNLKLDWLFFLCYSATTGSMKVASDIIQWRSAMNTTPSIKDEDEPAITNPQQLNE